MAFQGQVCNRWKFQNRSAYRWPLRRILSRIGKPWSHMESSLIVISSPPPIYCSGDGKSNAPAVLSRPELHFWCWSIGPVNKSAEKYLAKIDAYDAQSKFSPAHMEWMARKKEHLLACQERTWAAIENSITIFHLLPLNIRLYSKLNFESNRRRIKTLTHVLIRYDTSYLGDAKDWWGHWTSCTLHRTTRMSPSKALLATPILHVYSPHVWMATEPPIKVSPYGTPTTAFPQRRRHILTHIIRRLIRQPKESLRNVANSATNALQVSMASVTWQNRYTPWYQKLWATTSKKKTVVDWSAHQLKEGMKLLQADMEKCRNQDHRSCVSRASQLWRLRCSKFYKTVTRLLISQISKNSDSKRIRRRWLARITS